MSRNSSRLATQKMTRLALLAAVAVVLGYFEGIIIAFMSVSYTHLTLPTILRV